MFPGSSGAEYNFNYTANAAGTGYSTGYYENQPQQSQQSQQPQQFQHAQQQQSIYSTGPMSGTPSGIPSTGGGASSSAAFSGSNAFDNIDISRNGNRFSSGTPFETVHEFVSVSNKVIICR